MLATGMERISDFGDGLAFASKSSLFDFKVCGQQNASVGRNAIAGLNQNNVAGHYFVGWNHAHFAVTSNFGFSNDHVP